jgi:hypothetical protein
MGGMNNCSLATKRLLLLLPFRLLLRLLLPLLLLLRLRLSLSLLFSCHPSPHAEDLLLSLPLPLWLLFLLSSRRDLLLHLPLLVLLTQTKKRHFDRSCSRFCEQPSGEICFSTQTASQPLPRLCRCPCFCFCIVLAAISLCRHSDPERSRTGKNPETHDHPPPIDPFQPESQPSSSSPKTYPKPKNRDFDRSCSSFCEQRSGEIRSPTKTTSFHWVYHPVNLFFAIFRPKIACQAPNRLKSHKQNKIELAF